MIEFFNVAVQTQNRILLEQITLKIHKGEFVYLIGKTGAGKTTLLRLIVDNGQLLVRITFLSHQFTVQQLKGVLAHRFILSLIPPENLPDKFS